MTYLEFVKNWKDTILPNKETFIRDGQSLMNYLGEVWLKEYKRLSSINYYNESNIDCFYNDRIIDNTLKHLEKVWVNYPN